MITPRIGIGALVAIILAAGLFSAGMHYERNRLTVKHQAETIKLQEAALKQAREAREKESTWKQQWEVARNEATKRQQVIQADAAAARRTADSLRDQLAANRRAMSTATADAVRNYAATLSDIFEDCSGKYLEMAKAADGHASDVETLIESRPK